MSERIVVPDLSTGDAAVDAFAEAVRGNLERITGQTQNSVALKELTALSTSPEIIAQLNLVIRRLQGLGDGTSIAKSPPGPYSTPAPGPASPAPSPAPTPAPGPTPAPSPTPAPTPAPPGPAPAPSPAPGTAPFVPFGTQPDGAYSFGIAPTNYTLAQRIARIKTCYDAWKGNAVNSSRLCKSPTFVASHGGIFAGQTITDAYHVQWSSSDFACVSEGIGYGMQICVLMAGYDPNAQTYFNGLYRTARACPAYSATSTASANVYLMDYKLYPDMSSAGDGFSASDGDMDIIMALLMAHRQWGSSGTVNYYQQALNGIAALKTMFASNGLQWDSYHNLSRMSDYMIGHFRAFRAASGDAFWDNARTNSLAMMNTMVANWSPTAHLMPGFIYDPFGTSPTNTGPRPDTVVHVDGSGIEQYYDANSVRIPWRLLTDYVKSGDATVKTLCTNIVANLKASSGGDPAQTTFAYRLDGSPMSGLYYEGTTAGCLTAGACVDVAHQAFANLCFADASTYPRAGNIGFSTNYYESELMLLSLIVAAGLWWLP